MRLHWINETPRIGRINPSRKIKVAWFRGMAKGVKMDCIRTLYLYRMATANTPAWFFAKRDVSLSSRYYYITLHYYSERELRLDMRYIYFRWISPIFRNTARLRRGNWIGGAFGHAECAENASSLRSASSENESSREWRRFCTSAMETGTRGGSHFSSTTSLAYTV